MKKLIPRSLNAMFSFSLNNRITISKRLFLSISFLTILIQCSLSYSQCDEYYLNKLISGNDEKCFFEVGTKVRFCPSLNGMAIGKLTLGVSQWSGISTQYLTVTKDGGIAGTVVLKLKEKELLVNLNGCGGARTYSISLTKSEPVQTVSIGSQVWTSTNLNVSTYQNGDLIPEATDKNTWANLKTGAWCYYDNDPSNGIKYGKIYNWYAVNDSRGLAPKGYHIPTEAEWTKLTDYIGGVSVASIAMKSTSGWNDNLNGKNTSGFLGLPGGLRTGEDGEFSAIGSDGFWWSSSNPDPSYLISSAWMLMLNSPDSDVKMYSFGSEYGLSIRCVKD